MYNPPSNPVGVGIASFLQSFGGALQKRREDDSKERGKQAYYNYLEKLMGRKIDAQKSIAKTKASGGNNDIKVYQTLVNSKNKAIAEADTYIGKLDPMGIMDPTKKQALRADYLSKNQGVADTIKKGIWAEQKLAESQGFGKSQDAGSDIGTIPQGGFQMPTTGMPSMVTPVQPEDDDTTPQ